MNNKIKQKGANKQQLKSNIRLKPQPNAQKKLKQRKENTSSSNALYLFSWAAVAMLSVGAVSYVVVGQGGVEDAIQTAQFNQLNRKVAENNLTNFDNLPTASIPKNEDKPSIEDAPPKPLDFRPYVKEDAKKSDPNIGTTYFSAFLGQSEYKEALIETWYEIKSLYPDAVEDVPASYYFDESDQQYKLMAGKFKDLGETLKFCALMKFNDVSCQYDQKFINLSVTNIE